MINFIIRSDLHCREQQIFYVISVDKEWDLSPGSPSRLAIIEPGHLSSSCAGFSPVIWYVRNVNGTWFEPKAFLSQEKAFRYALWVFHPFNVAIRRFIRSCYVAYSNMIYRFKKEKPSGSGLGYN